MWAYPWNNIRAILLHSVLVIDDELPTVAEQGHGSLGILLAVQATKLGQGDGLDGGCIKLCDIITGRIVLLLMKRYLHLFLEVSVCSCELYREFSDIKWNVVGLLVWVNIVLVDWNVVIVFS